MSNLARCIAKARAVIEAMKLEIAAREWTAEKADTLNALLEKHKHRWAHIDREGMN